MAKEQASRTTEKFKVLSRGERAEPVVEPFMDVTLKDWRRIMKRIEERGEALQGVESFAWTCIGIAGGAFVGLLTFPFSAQFATEGHINWLAWATLVMLFLLTLTGLATGEYGVPGRHHRPGDLCGLRL